jgi:hypothetical protein
MVTFDPSHQACEDRQTLDALEEVLSQLIGISNLPRPMSLDNMWFCQEIR